MLAIDKDSVIDAQAEKIREVEREKRELETLVAELREQIRYKDGQIEALKDAVSQFAANMETHFAKSTERA